jgi:ribosomal protein S18 acetylase RimI-like enzyme
MLTSSSSIEVRRGKSADAKAIAEVFRQSWRQAYSGIIPHAHLESIIRQRGVEWWQAAFTKGEDVLVLQLFERIAGYATIGPARTRSSQKGEIYEIYLDPVHQGVGLGEHLFEACRDRLDRRLLNGLIVWALSDNTAATDFYWRRGGRPIARSLERIGSARLEKIAFAWD